LLRGRKFYIYLSLVAILFFILGFFLFSKTFADDIYTSIVVTKDGNTSTGPIFKSDGMNAQGPWYPGYSASEVLRIKNRFGSKVTINNLGMHIYLYRNEEQLDFNNEDSEDYMDKMLIKINYKNPLDNFFKGTIYEGNFKEFKNGVDCSIPVNNNKDIDLVYTITMDESAEINIAGIEGKIDFTVGILGDEISKKINRKDSDDHWAHDCIDTLIKHGIIQGYPDNTIRPDNYITRVEAAVLVGRALGLEEKDSIFTGYFDSIPNWARGYIISTSEEGIFKGYPGRLFKANNYITREEMTAVLIRAFNKTLENNIELQFKDKDNIANWAVEYVKAGVQNNIIEGYPDNTFKPNGNITRGEAFTMICKLLGYHDIHEETSKQGSDNYD
jgi:hypothetical protein